MPEPRPPPPSPQAAAVGDQLVVGLVPDSEILRCKGPPILDERERLALVQSVKWVDEVLTGAPPPLPPLAFWAPAPLFCRQVSRRRCKAVEWLWHILCRAPMACAFP